MALTNADRVGKALLLLRDGLSPFVEQEMLRLPQGGGLPIIERFTAGDRNLAGTTPAQWDVYALMKFMWEEWNEVFKRTLGQTERSLVSELRGYRDRWAHQKGISGDDAYRAMDSAERLLAAVNATQADEVARMKQELMRLRYDEQVRSEARRQAGAAIETTVLGVLPPWREVVTPHRDVASGRYSQAEFAADLHQVHIGGAGDEYQDPVEFFRRTYLTESLRALLVGAVRRLAGEGGDPVVQLQTNFGGGKTHSMLALYHLFSGSTPASLPGIDEVLAEAGVDALPAVRRVVIVGNKLSPGRAELKADGTEVKTLWGEIAWQLGGRAAYEQLRADDENATSPGDMLRKLFEAHGPCLVLIDEWVAYARQLHEDRTLPGGTFETHFSFAQALTESAKLAPHCLLVVSLPASDTPTSPHADVDDAEVGGIMGRTALGRLRHVIGRLESSWRPATSEEGFEIVRRRLFEPMGDAEQFKKRDVVARGFADFYRAARQEFPPECADADYEKRMKSAYPIHPEVFDRLYSDWSTLLKFQRTRGVLRLMAKVIHDLWEKGDRSPLIMPGTISIDDAQVQSELTRYLPENWVPVIAKDVDGAQSLPVRIDHEVPNLGKHTACRRVARAIYLGSAPLTAAAHQGIEDRRIKLGCMMPGESPLVFNDALRRLAGSAMYLYQDGTRYWYATQPTVTKLAEDRAAQLQRDGDAVRVEIERRLREDLRKTGDFGRVHVAPESGNDVLDEMDARLVVLGADHTYQKGGGSVAESVARTMLEMRGSAPRLYRNTLVFLAPDATRMQDLDEAVRRFLAWTSIVAEKDALNLTPHQVRQAEQQRGVAESAVLARLPETWMWLLVPVQAKDEAVIRWNVVKLSGAEALAVRASRKLRSEEELVVTYAGTLVRMQLDAVPLWRGDGVQVKTLVDDYARYLYLPRLLDSNVLLRALRDGVERLTWADETFAYADARDESTGRYTGLRLGEIGVVDVAPGGWIVKPEVALAQREREERERAAARGVGEGPAPHDAGGEDASVVVDAGNGAGDGRGRAGGSVAAGGDGVGTAAVAPRRFHATVTLDPTRAGRDAGQIATEILAHLASIVGADVRVTLEIDAALPPGAATPSLIRTITENATTLKFTSHAFERE